jgi:hypothetical protein
MILLLILFEVLAESLDFGSLHEADNFHIVAHEVYFLSREFGDHGPT